MDRERPSQSEEQISPERRAPLISTEEFKNGDIDAFERIKYPMMTYIKRISLSLSAEDVENIFQLTIEKAWARLDSYIPGRGAGFESWIFAIAHNTTIDYLRRKKNRPSISLENEESEGVIFEDKRKKTPEEEAIISEEKLLLRNALDQLPEVQREVIQLNFFEELTQVEIANSTSIPLGTVKTRQRLGFRKLENILDPEGNSSR